MALSYINCNLYCFKALSVIHGNTSTYLEIIQLLYAYSHDSNTNNV